MTTVKSILKNLLGQELIKYFKQTFVIIKLKLRNFNNDTPVIIYSMGKSGTSTVSASLKRAGVDFYKIHNLSYSGIANSEKRSKNFKNKTVPHVTKLGKIIRQKIDKKQSWEKPWRIISLTREPIGHAVSNLFQGIENRRPDLIDHHGNIKIESALEDINDMLSNLHEPSLTWFDNELKSTFGIDVYKYPYNHQEGFIIIRNHKVEILILRAEDLNRSLKKAITAFLGIEIEVKLANVGEDKNFAQAYQKTKNMLKVDSDVCKKIYATKHVNHFYTETEIEELITKWSDFN